jgi:hypothetical protein
MYNKRRLSGSWKTALSTSSKQCSIRHIHQILRIAISILLGTVKQRRQTCQGYSFEDLEEKVHEILGSTTPTELTATIRAWMVRLQRVINRNGE